MIRIWIWRETPQGQTKVWKSFPLIVMMRADFGGKERLMCEFFIGNVTQETVVRNRVVQAEKKGEQKK